MDSVKRSAVTPSKSRLARTFAKVLHIKSVTGIASVNRDQKTKSSEKIRRIHLEKNLPKFLSEEDEKLQQRAATEAFLAKLFASISSIKAAYAELQFSQAPYDADGIQSADQMVVSELKNLSELKQCYVKKQYDYSSPETTQLLAEIEEQNCLLRTYEVTLKKLDSQLKLKDSEITFLREKLEEENRENKSLAKRMNASGHLLALDTLYLSGLNPCHFITVLRQTIKSVRAFVKLMISKMESAGWDLVAAACVVEPGIVNLNLDYKFSAFESFVCREMFDGFSCPDFFPPNEHLPEQKQKQQQQQHFFDRFMELKSIEFREYIARKPKSSFGKFCRRKYLQLINAKTESSLFGNLNQRNLLESGDYPDTTFFVSFAEMARWVWLLHCLAFSFNPAASIFRVMKGSRFSDVYMECVNEKVFMSSDGSSGTEPRVALTVVPGFRIGKTVIQCQVYLVLP